MGAPPPPPRSLDPERDLLAPGKVCCWEWRDSLRTDHTLGQTYQLGIKALSLPRNMMPTLVACCREE